MYTYQARKLHRPTSIAQAQKIVAGAEKVRALGTRHTFNYIADSTELITLAGLPANVSVDRDAGTVSCSAGMSYGRLAEVLQAEGPGVTQSPVAGPGLGGRRGRDGDPRLGRRDR